MLVSFKTVIFNWCASGWRLYIGQNSAKVNASVKHWNLINITKNCTLISLFKKKKPSWLVSTVCLVSEYILSFNGFMPFPANNHHENSLDAGMVLKSE